MQITNLIQDVFYLASMLGMVFLVWKSVQGPQEKESQRAALLAQQVQIVAESVDRRFKDAQDSFQLLLLQSNNHIHTVDTKVEMLKTNVNDLSREIVKLQTIIEERIPNK